MNELLLPESYLREQLSPTDFQVLQLLKPDQSGDLPSLTIAELVQKTGKGKSTISDALSNLREHGIVETHRTEGEAARQHRLTSRRIFQ
jgi:DNA-binding IclR family transcriptional regulator